MSKAADVGKVSAKGSFHYLWGLVASTIISSVGTIVIAGLLGSELYGLYGIALGVPSLIGMFRDWGINMAMVRCIAQYRAEGRESEIRSVVVSGFLFEIVIGLLLSIITFLLSGFLADLYNRPTIAPLIQIVSIVILANGIINAATAAFTGLERMELNSVMLISQSVIKTALILLLVSPLFGLGAYGASIGFITGALVAGVIGVILILSIYRKLPKAETFKLEVKAYIHAMLVYGVPLSIAGFLSSLLAYYYAFLLPLYTEDNAIIGNYNIAMNFVVLISFFAIPITTMLFPAFSKLDPVKDHAAFQNVYQYSVKYASLLVAPVCLLVMALAEPAVTALFNDAYSYAPLFLVLLSITYLYTAAGGLTTGNLINSQGQTKYNLKLSILTSIIGFPLGAVLILNFGVFGIIGVSLTAGLPSLIISLRWIEKKYDLKVDWLSSAKILLSSIITGIITYLLITKLTISPWLELIIGAVVFILVFVLVALLTRTVTREDLNNINTMVSALGPLGNIITRLLSIVEKIMKLLHL